MTITTTADFDTITAAEVREGDLIQQAKRYWPAQTVTRREEHYGRLTFELSGGSRVTGVAPSATFIRYAAPAALPVVESVNEGQMSGQLRIGGDDVRAEITEDFFLVQTAPAPKAAPPVEPMPQPGFWDDAEIIHAYTRAQAIEDGALVDVSETAREAGFKYPVAMTREAWCDLVQWTADDEKRKPEGTGQSEAGRLWDVLTMAGHYSRRGPKTDRVLCEVLRVPAEGRGLRPRKAQFRALCGPGDTAEPVVTLMLPHES